MPSAHVTRKRLKPRKTTDNKPFARQKVQVHGIDTNALTQAIALAVYCILRIYVFNMIKNQHRYILSPFHFHSNPLHIYGSKICM